MTDTELAAILRLQEQFQREVARSVKVFEPVGREIARVESEFRSAVKRYEPLLRESAKFFEEVIEHPPPHWTSWCVPTPAISNERSKPKRRRPIGFGPWPGED